MKRLCLMLGLAGMLMAQSPPANGDAKVMPNHCAANPPLGDISAQPSWNGWGNGTSNARYQGASAQLTSDQIPNLKLKWAFGFPGAKTVYGQPTVVAGRVFLGVDTGYVYSINASTGCLYWSYLAAGPVRSAISIGPSKAEGENLVYFGDLKGNVYAVNASTGAEVWKVALDTHPWARITGAPQLYENRLYVPVASFEEVAAANPDYECCKFRGSVAALDPQTGRQIWRTYIIPDSAKPTVKNSKGTQQYGPAGGGVWNSPTLDPKRRALYVGTGDAYTAPAARTTDAIVALDMDNGRMLWSMQDQPGDAWVVGCPPTNTPSPNCPKENGPDYDFGSSPILKNLPNGSSILIAGQKSGIVWAHDPDRKGAVVWKTSVFTTAPTSEGQITFGGSADDRNSYFGLKSGGVVALANSNGERKWFTPVEPMAGRGAGEDAAVSLIPGVVFSGGRDGFLRALSSSDGKILWQFDMQRDFPTVNGVIASGGAMGSAGPTIVGGMVFAGSGYTGPQAGRNGNVLLAFGL